LESEVGVTAVKFQHFSHMVFTRTLYVLEGTLAETYYRKLIPNFDDDFWSGGAKDAQYTWRTARLLSD
jgi:hypothetical protein